MRFSDLPTEDWLHMEETLGPPPSWLQMSTTSATPGGYMQHNYSGLGEREEEAFEVDPVEKIQEMKFKQEMSKRIPIQAARYTEVNPLSPMFRARKAKFGFGAAIKEKKSYITFIVIGALIWFLFLRKKAAPK